MENIQFPNLDAYIEARKDSKHVAEYHFLYRLHRRKPPMLVYFVQNPEALDALAADARALAESDADKAAAA